MTLARNKGHKCRLMLFNDSLAIINSNNTILCTHSLYFVWVLDKPGDLRQGSTDHRYEWACCERNSVCTHQHNYSSNVRYMRVNVSAHLNVCIMTNTWYVCTYVCRYVHTSAILLANENMSALIILLWSVWSTCFMSFIWLQTTDLLRCCLFFSENDSHGNFHCNVTWKVILREWKSWVLHNVVLKQRWHT